ncbi:hypothetical protein Patl1_25857 [Pistacia atlantica]|uniref:Uncharacterized protein n=1 Tax=Pistacia atlantica TaxID=434234 RepID=A0ACC1AZY5_9ROSI|nr:hypothetical protein Patl1_25857 [Pistacia atlantica]
MATACYRFLLFVFLALHFTAFEADDNHQAKVHVISTLPKDGGQMSLTCLPENSDPGFGGGVSAGVVYSWSVDNNLKYRCQSFWKNQFALWVVFEPERDANHGEVFWLVRQDAFFLSWDNSTWVEKYTWETE